MVNIGFSLGTENAEFLAAHASTGSAQELLSTCQGAF
jgi:hypothetical protein